MLQQASRSSCCCSSRVPTLAAWLLILPLLAWRRWWLVESFVVTTTSSSRSQWRRVVGIVPSRIKAAAAVAAHLSIDDDDDDDGTGAFVFGDATASNIAGGPSLASSSSATAATSPTAVDGSRYNVSLLLIDHYDSFTYNLYDMLAQLTVVPPVVIAKDAYDDCCWDGGSGGSESGPPSCVFDSYDGIVLSPGPGTPYDQPAMSRLAATSNPHLPVLGVCLGHQLLAIAYGASVGRAPVPVHGQDHWIEQKHQQQRPQEQRPKEQEQDGETAPPPNNIGGAQQQLHPPHPSLFQGLPGSFRVVRYHSLCAYGLHEDDGECEDDHTQDQKTPPLLRVTAKSNDGVVQAVQHRTRPHYGVQFHPESVGTQYGMAILENFVKVVQSCKEEERRRSQREEREREEQERPPVRLLSPIVGGTAAAAAAAAAAAKAGPTAGTTAPPSSSSTPAVAPSPSRFRVLVHRVELSRVDTTTKTTTTPPPCSPRPVDVFERFYNSQRRRDCDDSHDGGGNCDYAVWLDSSSYPVRGEVDIMAAPSIRKRRQGVSGGEKSEEEDDDRDHDPDLSNDVRYNDGDILEYNVYEGDRRGRQEKLRGGTDSLHGDDHDADDKEISGHVDGDNDILTQLEEQLFGNKAKAFGNPPDGKPKWVPSSSIGWVTTTRQSRTVENDDDDNSVNVNEQNRMAIEWHDEIGYSSEAPHGRHPGHPPFHYRGGYLGFLGYEVRHDTHRYLQRQQQGGGGGSVTSKPGREKQEKDQPSSVPTAAFFLARQSMVYHHPTDTWYLIGLTEENEDVQENLKWMEETSEELRTMVETEEIIYSAQDATASSTNRMVAAGSAAQGIDFVANRSKSCYKQDIAECHEYIKMGESYELCLTNQLEAHVPEPTLRTFDLYKILRRRNAAPYSAYLRWNIPVNSVTKHNNEASSTRSSFVICSSSPERFMSVTRQKPHPEVPSFLQAEAKPIKGTCARVMPENDIDRTDAEAREDERRARSLELSLKNRAENLMIVDLLRNDMSRICQVGTVHVAKLMDIESFATVHQMVSTIRGTLAESFTSIDLLRASFPGGSMTGAPKIRTMELLEVLEQNVDRGPYAGSLGYLSVNGSMDMNIIIRSAIVTRSSSDSNLADGWKISIGAGGAITALSEAQDEYDEMELKASVVVASVQEWASTITERSMAGRSSTPTEQYARFD